MEVTLPRKAMAGQNKSQLTTCHVFVAEFKLEAIKQFPSYVYRTNHSSGS